MVMVIISQHKARWTLTWKQGSSDRRAPRYSDSLFRHNSWSDPQLSSGAPLNFELGSELHYTCPVGQLGQHARQPLCCAVSVCDVSLQAALNSLAVNHGTLDRLDAAVAATTFNPPPLAVYVAQSRSLWLRLAPAQHRKWCQWIFLPKI